MSVPAAPDPADLLARVALNHALEPGLSAVAREVADRGAVDVYQRLRRGLGPNGTPADAEERLARLDPERDLDRARRAGLRFVVPGDAEWPVQLEDLAHVPDNADRGGVPLGLWVRGPLRLDTLAASVAVVGARSATAYGTEVARGIAHTLAERGWAVVSGAAFGIDAAAHRGAVSGGGVTVAVLACGADRAYPQAHERLLAHLAATSAVISEAPPGAAPMKVRFLARNRLIAALGRGTVVVEAAPRSGALNSATWADGLSREVMGVPGPVTSVTSAGVHLLLRRGATLVTSGTEVLETVGAPGEFLTVDARGPERARDRLSTRQQQVLDALPVGHPASAASVARAAGIAPRETSTVLSELARGGLAEAAGGGWRLGPDADT